MGILLSLTSAAAFGLGMVFTRKGMRSRRRDDGHFMTVLVNVVLLGSALSIAGSPAWRWEGIVAFMIAGVLTTFAGRGLTMRAIRFVGPARGSAFIMGAPVVAALAGAVFLAEPVGLREAAGGLVVLAGLGVLVRSKIAVEPLVGEVPVPAAAHVRASDDGGARPQDTGPVIAHSSFHRRGYAYSAIAMVAFGLGFVVSKWGVIHVPSAVSGAFVGAVTALTLISVKAVATRGLGRLVQDNLRSVPLLFVASGILTSVGLLTRYWAFLSLEAWIVSLLNGTQALWTLLWSRLLLRAEDAISRELFVAVVLVSVGVGILALPNLDF